MGAPAAYRTRVGTLTAVLVDSWRTSAASGPGEPVVFWRGDLGVHWTWPAEVDAMTRTEAEELVLLGLARAAYPASEVMMISPTRHAIATVEDCATATQLHESGKARSS